MKKWIAIAVVLLTTLSVFGQKAVMSEKSTYYAKNYLLDSKIGCIDDNYFILLNLFLKKKNVIEVGDKFQIMSGIEPITFIVTQDIFDKMDEKGFVSFPIEIQTVELLSRNNNKIYFLKDGAESLKLRAWSRNLKSLATSVLNNRAIVIQATEPGKKIYPSWRD